MNIYFNQQPIPFLSGQTIAAALLHAGLSTFGPLTSVTQARYFCGIGMCQGCLVRKSGGAIVEACITLCEADMQLESVMTSGLGDGHE